MKKNINWEKLSVYLATLGFVFLLWSSQSKMIFALGDMKERIARLEVKVEHLEGHNVRAK